jgi:tetratricopeptide (TPR) repeat protein
MQFVPSAADPQAAAPQAAPAAAPPDRFTPKQDAAKPALDAGDGDTESDAAAIARAALALRSGHADAAERICRRLIAHRPQAAAHHLLGMIAARAGNLAEARQHFAAAVAMDPNDSDDHHNLGNVLQQLGEPQAALDCYERALALRPHFIEALFQRARLLEMLQQPAAAECAYRALLVHAPDYAPGHCQLGRLLLTQKRYDEALAPLDRAVALQPELAEAWCNKGVALLERRELEAALDCQDRALALRPELTDALFNRAVVLDQLGRWEDSLACYRKLLALQPTLKAALCEVGKLLLMLTRFDEALEALEQALAAYPDLAEAWCNKGAALHGQGRFEEAVAAYDEALRLDPEHADSHYNKGNALGAMKREEEALVCLERALELKPDYVSALSNKGTVLLTLQRPTEALACFDQALELDGARAAGLHLNRGIAFSDLGRPYDALAANGLSLSIDPEGAGAHHNEAMFRLLVGDFAVGWRENRWRWKGQNRTEPGLLLGRPLWDGVETLAGRRVLLTCEQGLGDTIQFCRYAEKVAQAGATAVLLGVQDGLQRLLRSLEHADLVVETDGRLPPFDVHCPLFDLPGYFGTTLETIPARVPYLRAPRHAITAWNRRLGRPGVKRVGFVWAGNPGHAHDRKRSMKLAQLLPLLCSREAASCQFVCLQKVMTEADRALLDTLPNVTVPGEAIVDFIDTAAIAETLDLVITIDTSVAHLAGALARPVWIMITFSPDWRWLLGRSDSPWYPTARLFRQPAIGDWESVIAAVTRALPEALAAGPAAAA